MVPTTKITLTPRELKKISEFIADTTNGSQIVTIHVDSSSGIGSTVHATVWAEINGWTGEFTAVITDESCW
jgi:hypothetical protein